MRIENQGLRIKDSGFRIENQGLRIKDSGLRIEDSGLRIEDSGNVHRCAMSLLILIDPISYQFSQLLLKKILIFFGK